MTTGLSLPLPDAKSLARSRALSAVIKQAVIAANHALPFAEFMRLALYHPQFGYYQVDHDIFGEHGDFITAAEISPLFAQCIARQCMDIFAHLSQKNIVELGAGTGRLAKELLLYLQRMQSLPDVYYIVETSPVLEKKQKYLFATECPQLLSRVQWLSSLPSDFVGILFANEVLDAQPVHCFSIDNGEIKQRCVSLAQDEFIWQHENNFDRPLQIELEEIATRYALPNHYASEINAKLSVLIQNLTQCMSQGVILLCDYGYGQKEYYHPARCHGTLSCFYQHRHHDNPFIYPGLQDLTAHVDFTRVIEYAASSGFHLAGFTTQAAFLFNCELLHLVEDAQKEMNAKMTFELQQAIKVLTLPNEMGERIKVMALSKHVDATLLGFRLQDRSRDL